MKKTYLLTLLCSISPVTIFTAENKNEIIDGPRRIEILNQVIQAETSKKKCLEKMITETEPFINVSLAGQLKESRTRIIELHTEKITLLTINSEAINNEINESRKLLLKLEKNEISTLDQLKEDLDQAEAHKKQLAQYKKENIEGWRNIFEYEQKKREEKQNTIEQQHQWNITWLQNHHTNAIAKIKALTLECEKKDAEISELKSNK